MTGVEILAAEEVAVEFTFNWTIFWITVGMMALIGLAIGLINLENCGWPFIPMMLTVCTVLGSLLGVCFGKVYEKPAKYETQYKITVSDDVCMNDLLDKHEIVDIEGKIFTVREKKGEE